MAHDRLKLTRADTYEETLLRGEIDYWRGKIDWLMWLDMFGRAEEIEGYVRQLVSLFSYYTRRKRQEEASHADDEATAGGAP